jgi:hypothetical protein
MFSKFNDILESIFSSEFFERIDYTEKLKSVSPKEIEFFKLKNYSIFLLLI